MSNRAAAGNYLGPAIVAALVLHGAVIFGIGFRSPHPDAATRDLDIILVRQAATAAPRSSHAIAALSQLGDDLAHSPAVPGNRATDAGADALYHDVADLRSRLQRQRQQHAALPDTLVLTAASATASNQANYLKHWIERVERVGNDNYPEQARRQGIFGAIRLAVTLERDGQVAGIDILQSSGHRMLDQAALHTLRLAAPFAPVPESIAGDRIEIIRTWHFVPGHQFIAATE